MISPEQREEWIIGQARQSLHDGVPVPKVIDFGIAKATQQELTEKTVYRQLQQFLGTPAYMSPEQAEMSGLHSVGFSPDV